MNPFQYPVMGGVGGELKLFAIASNLHSLTRNNNNNWKERANEPSRRRGRMIDLDSVHSSVIIIIASGPENAAHIVTCEYILWIISKECLFSLATLSHFRCCCCPPFPKIIILTDVHPSIHHRLILSTQHQPGNNRKSRESNRTELERLGLAF